MAVEKTESAAASGAQGADVAKVVAKKPKKTTDGGKKLSAMEKVVADAKALYSDLDTSSGRKMRKRPASTAAAPAKKAKKAPAKKPAAKKTTAKKAENGKSE